MWRCKRNIKSTFYHQIELSGFIHSFHIPANLEKYESIAGVPLCSECSVLIFKMNNNELCTFAYIMTCPMYFDKCEILDGKVLS